MYSGPENFLSANPHFCKSALARYTPWDFIALVNDYEIAYHEKTLGQLFCDNSSKDILNMLLAEAEKVAVEIRLNTEIHSVEKNDAGFELNTAAGQFTVPRLVIATGGLSIPKMGATGFGYQIAKQFGLKTEPTRAGLVPLTLSGKPLEAIAPLSGLALTAVKVSSNDGQVFEEAMLCTHRGISGPAVLQISSFWQPGETVLVDLLPNVDAEAWLAEMVAEQPKAELRTVLAYKLPKRFAEMLCQQYGSPRLNSLNEKQLLEWAARLHAWEIKPSGTEGYRTAEVTLGGVSTDELSSKTMECKTVPGLYFVGEVVDVTGHLGGHNFQWAWASAHAAGEAVAGVA
jgi:predicted Rossmann fold flavoprotein